MTTRTKARTGRMLIGTLMALAVTAGGLAGSVRGAEPIYLKDSVFEIPVELADQTADIAELHLYYSTDRGANWKLAKVSAPTRTSFKFQSQADGEYWFLLVHVDRQGNAHPAGLEGAAPDLKVVIDTARPNLTMKPIAPDADRIGIAWSMDDEKLDLSSFEVEVRDDATTSWERIDAPAMREGDASWIAEPGKSYTVRARIRDAAGNESVHELALGSAGVASQPAWPMPPSFAPADVPLEAPRQLPFVDPAAASAGNSSPEVFDPGRPAIPAETAAISHELADRIPVASTISTSGIQPVSAALPMPEPTKRIPLVNSKKFVVDYQVQGAGPAGVGKVELWYTTDNGQSWKRYGEDRDKVPPFEVDLPGEGRYGLNVVVTNPAGYGQKPPRAGDVPQMQLEVDLTPPQAELYQPVPDPHSSGALLISWSARDPHLGGQPVSLYFAERPEGPWFAVKEGLPATGEFSWQVPQNAPYQVHLRLDVKDLGKNTSVAKTTEPVLVDFSRPVGTITNIALMPGNSSVR